jgi:hypothetical protein
VDFYVTELIDQMFCIHQIWGKKWKDNGEVHLPFIAFILVYADNILCGKINTIKKNSEETLS